MMKIVSWNCRGLGSNHKKEELKKLLQVEKPSILMLQETKLGELETLKDLQKIWNNCDGRAVSSRGASSGIKILWKRENFDLQAQTQTQFWLRVNLLNKTSGMLFSIINVYIPNNYNEKIECWQSLIDLAKETPPPPPRTSLLQETSTQPELQWKKEEVRWLETNSGKDWRTSSQTWTSMMSPQAKGSTPGTIEEQGRSHRSQIR
jgi:hypothetical protein